MPITAIAMNIYNIGVKLYSANISINVVCIASSPATIFTGNSLNIDIAERTAHDNTPAKNIKDPIITFFIKVPPLNSN